MIEIALFLIAVLVVSLIWIYQRTVRARQPIWLWVVAVLIGGSFWAILIHSFVYLQPR